MTVNDDQATRKTPDEWAAEHGYQILDPDGWRNEGDPPYDQPITYAEFWPRLYRSTITRVSIDSPAQGANARDPRIDAWCRYRWHTTMPGGSDEQQARMRVHAASELQIIDAADPLRQPAAAEARRYVQRLLARGCVHYTGCAGSRGCTCTADRDIRTAFGLPL